MFHGHLSAEEAQSLLSKKKPGSFLIRASENSPGYLVIAYVATDARTTFGPL